MSLLDEAARKLRDEVEEHADEWLDRGLEAAQALIDEHLQGGDAAMASDVVEVLAIHRDYLADMGRYGVGALLVKTGVGLDMQAREQFLTTRSSKADDVEGIMQAANKALRETRRRELAWEGLSAMLASVGKAALRLAVPFLLAAL